MGNANYSDRKQISDGLEMGKEWKGSITKGCEKILGVMNMLIIRIMVMVSQVNTSEKNVVKLYIL